MLFYDWEKILTVSKGKPSTILRILKMLINDEIPKNEFDPLYTLYQHHYGGSSFLLHPDVLIHNAYKHSYKDICLYVGLASLRNVSDYLTTKTLSLELIKCPFDPRITFDDLTLVPIKDGEVHFIYEDKTLQTVH